ncbi:hypothetical protein MPSEU_000053300 [Mayamaea pseudoterrestris]|nr:hypothetical protein MPSEU_000053300 [Mayamaea pseudoterrestris]
MAAKEEAPVDADASNMETDNDEAMNIPSVNDTDDPPQDDLVEIPTSEEQAPLQQQDQDQDQDSNNWPGWYQPVRPLLQSANLQAPMDALVLKHGVLVPLSLLVLAAAIIMAFRSSRRASPSESAATSTIHPPPNMITSLFFSMLSLVRQTLGVTLGVGLGLGFAAHVYDALTLWKERDMEMRRKNDIEGGGMTSRASMSKSISNAKSSSLLRSTFKDSQIAMNHEQTYDSLMRLAGYDTVRNHCLRGQVLRSNDSFFTHNSNYSYDGAKPLNLLQTMYPMLPLAISRQLGMLMDYVLRDFCATWCCKLDVGCVSPYDVETGKLIKPAVKVNGNDTSSDDACNAGGMQQQQNVEASPTAHARRMVYQLNPYRNVAIMEQLYQSMTIVFGNLATRVEHVNVLELLLLKVTKVLTHTFQVYRTLRRCVTTKHKSHHATSTLLLLPDVAPTEMQMAKEFLLSGKLHKAVTFGVDVPSLLFADAQGKECGWPNEHDNSADGNATTSSDAHSKMDQDKLLEERLFRTGLLSECEIDYNRVLAHRMVRALLARNDFGSNILSSILTEILGQSVLPPLMSCFCPEYLNSWIVAGLSSSTVSTTVDAAVVESNVAAASLSLDGVEAPDETALTRNESEQTNAGVETEEGAATQPDGNAAVGDHATHDDQSAALHRVDSDDKTVDFVDESPAQTLDESGDKVNSLLAVTLIDLQQYVDFEDFRLLKSQNEPVNIDWDDSGCREAILRLVLVVEQTLTNGRCTYKPVAPPEEVDEAAINDGVVDLSDEDDNVAVTEEAVELSLPEFEFTSLSQILMELTSDLDAFEERVAKENTFQSAEQLARFDAMELEEYKVSATEQSTLRTLIAAWLHTGQIYRVITVLVQAHTSVLAPYFAESAFLRSAANANGFVRQLKALDGVEILVDTMMVLSAPRLDETNREDLNALVKKSVQTSSKATSMTSSSIIRVQQMTTSSTPRYLDFNRNESFAASLRAERERRLRSWQHVVDDDVTNEGLPVLCHAQASERDAALHKELHHLARIFYSGTNMIAIRDAARNKRQVDESSSQTESVASEVSIPVSLLTVETSSARRRIEIPDDDSSFLLRAQPRPLNAVGVHRDQRNHDQSFKCFAATYDEPALNRTEHYAGGRFVRSCLVRYFPIDRTATVALQEGSARKLDQRRGTGPIPDTITVGQSRSAPLLSNEFLNERHLCQRWTPKGTNRTQGIMSSSILEPTDFNLMPRSGRAIDFVYRLSLFERPMIELGGKHFTVNDSSSLGTHRAEASSLELSDATLSAALNVLGHELGSKGESSDGTLKNVVEMGEDGYPILWMKFNRAENDSQVEIKPYRVSFVRAALLVTSARHEAQLQNLLACVRAGSVKKATKVLTDQRLKSTAKVLEYASSRIREKQSVLLRDLKVGVNHIDREQLRRNGLLDPRYPTVIRELTATIEDVVESTKGQGNGLFGASDTMYKIRCQAVVDIYALSSELRGDPTFQAPDGSIAKTMREEWVVLRSYDDFNKFHKHLKAQVAVTESSGNAGTRLVGAATAAFAAGAAVAGASGVARSRQRVALIPSLGQASKASLGPAKKLLQKRKEALDGYLNVLLAPRHLLNRCTELLIFLGAVYPLPSEILPNQVVLGVADPLGRTEMSRKVIQSRLASVKMDQTVVEQLGAKSGGTRRDADTTDDTDDLQDDDEFLDDYDDDDRERKSNMIPAIESKISKVPLAFVRRQLFELLHHLFGFENASFVRNRMLTALKTMSFAVTTGSEFKRTLYRLHCEKLSADAVADWIAFALNLIWPDGEFFSKAAPSSPEELRDQSRQAMDALHSSFPEQIRSVLGKELTRDGLNMLHEMLQNRLVVKSIFYILMDMLWLDVFPELGDVVECGLSIDLNNRN